ncbi:MAG: ATP-dependent DNA helicase RecG [Lachnospiraceae bacterium]|nr:ATP-dependent DNA helicase RecG [Lachnospiraceae bacterium]
MRQTSPVTSLKGIGPKTAGLLEKLDIRTVEDLLENYPRDYDYFAAPTPILSCPDTGIVSIRAVITGKPYQAKKGNLQILTVWCEDGSGKIKLIWFHMPYLVGKLIPGSRYVFRGRIHKKDNSRFLEQPALYSPAEYETLEGSRRPIYSLTAGLTSRTLAKAVEAALARRPLEGEYLPLWMREEYGLADPNFAGRAIHFPKNEEELRLARTRLVFEEFFFFLSAIRRLKTEERECPNRFPLPPVPETEMLLSRLPYRLTKAQERVWREISGNLNGNTRMSRLIQGDVGSGKTILAFLALLQVTGNGYQGAMMAPTEVLARQHYESLTKLLEQYGIKRRVVLLTGSMTAKEKRLAYDRIETGAAEIILGTHAVIQERVRFAGLALVITDEQHRFGVRQREAFSDKGEEKEPHILVMSATPIPRTLAIILYGDLDISVIDELPAGRLPIKNCVVGPDYRENAWRFIERELQAGHQAYVICPMVEENDSVDLENVVDYRKKLQKRLGSGRVVGMLHGRMRPGEKNAVMDEFLSGRIQVLVSTTVVEVGVNVPNATVMLVENAERFGLAQLHQLRGRVGRGTDPSYCIFLNGTGETDKNKRLQVLVRSNDGFYIASEDLKLRGPGDLFGIRQSGAFEFALGDVFTDAEILRRASEASKRLEAEDPELSSEENKELKKKLTAYLVRNRERLYL